MNRLSSWDETKVPDSKRPRESRGLFYFGLLWSIRLGRGKFRKREPLGISLSPLRLVSLCILYQWIAAHALRIFISMKFVTKYLLLSLIIPTVLTAGRTGSFELNAEWQSLIGSLAPAEPRVSPQAKRKVLVFTLMTGFRHWATPHTAEVVRILGEKSSAYEAVVSDDISHFEQKNIGQYDAIVLINNCSRNPGRHLFFDALGDMEQALILEQNLIQYVAAGHGLVSIHGGIVMLNNSEMFGEVMGGAFDYHPKQTTVVGRVLDHSHPISTAFDGEDFSHHDEPYCFKGAYAEFNFHPLLEMALPDFSEADQAKVFQPGDRPIKRYISWIKPYGAGRVFYCSPSHNAQSFEDPKLLRFLLNGIQYSLGDLECDDSPVGVQD